MTALKETEITEKFLLSLRDSVDNKKGGEILSNALYHTVYQNYALLTNKHALTLYQSNQAFLTLDGGHRSFFLRKSSVE